MKKTLLAAAALGLALAGPAGSKSRSCSGLGISCWECISGPATFPVAKLVQYGFGFFVGCKRVQCFQRIPQTLETSGCARVAKTQQSPVMNDGIVAACKFMLFPK